MKKEKPKTEYSRLKQQLKDMQNQLKEIDSNDHIKNKKETEGHINWVISKIKTRLKKYRKKKSS